MEGLYTQKMIIYMLGKMSGLEKGMKFFHPGYIGTKKENFNQQD